MVIGSARYALGITGIFMDKGDILEVVNNKIKSVNVDGIAIGKMVLANVEM